MTERAPDTVLRRMAEAGRGLSGSGVLTPERALGKAVAKTAQDMLKLPLVITRTSDTKIGLAEILECLPERSLIGVLQGPQDGLGLAVLSAETLTTLIEMQTTGRLSSAAAAARKPTRTDASMSVRFIDQMLAELELLLATDPALAWIGGFRYSSYLDDPRPLGLLLEDVAHRLVQIDVGFGSDGVRQGRILLILPAEGRGPVPARLSGAEPGTSDANAAQGINDWAENIELAVNETRAQLYGVLDRVQLPLERVLALAPGSIVEVSKGVLTRVRIEGHGNRFVAWGKLGQCQGNLAVRLHLTLDSKGEEMAELASEGKNAALSIASIPPME